jgi:uncharacterized membrane protein YuzA (DUF378 family)
MATMTERRHIPERRADRKVAGDVAARTSGRTMNAIDWIAMTLLIIGGVNWGLVGLFGFDLVATLFGDMTPISRLVYVLVGLSALYSIYTALKVGTDHT